MNNSNLIIDETFKRLIPPLSNDEFQALEKNVIDEGCRDALVVWNNTIIDGHNRYKICLNNNVDFKIITKNFIDANEAKAWMIINQFARRNLTPYVRAGLALKLKPLMATKAEENLHLAKGQGVKGLENSPKVKLDTRQEIAKKANVSDNTINKVERINKALEEKPNDELEEKLNTGEVSINQAFLEVVKKQKPIATKFTGEMEWYTPEKYIESARRVMGSIDVDPASNESANEIIKADQYYDLDSNGLEKDWCGNIWLNPPYGAKDIKNFVDKFEEQAMELNIKKAIILTNNNTDTGWFNKLVGLCDQVCFTKGRINFYRGQEISQPTNGQVFFYYGFDDDQFYQEFKKHGVIMGVYRDKKSDEI